MEQLGCCIHRQVFSGVHLPLQDHTGAGTSGWGGGVSYSPQYSTPWMVQNGEAMRSGRPIAATGLGGHRGSLMTGQRRRRAEGSLSGRESAQA